MLTKGYLKPFISIKAIGKFQFWIGLLFGIFSAFIFSIYFNYSREIFRSLTFVLTPYILSPKQFMIYDLFFASLSVSLAFGFTVIIWLTGRKEIKKQYYRMFAVGNIWLIIFMVLFVLLRMATLLNFGVQIGSGFDSPLDFIKDFWLILITLPLFIFFYYWNYLSLMFRTKYWISISILFYIFFTFLIFKTTSIDKSILNNIYYSKKTNYTPILEISLNSYSKLYGISYADSTKEILLNPSSSKLFDLINDVKNAFNTDSLVSLDTILLEKIIINNLDIQYEILKRYQSTENDIIWPYVEPEEIYTQIKRYENKHSIESFFLIRILNNMVFIFNAPEINWDKKYKYSELDIKRYRFKMLMKKRTNIENRLSYVVEKLMSDKNHDYRSLLTRMRN